MNLHFQYPYLLWALAALPLFILLFLAYGVWKRRAVRRMGDPKLVKALYPSHARGKVVFRFVLFLLAFALGCIAAANPRQPDEMQEDARKGIDVMIALDVSNSMLATDLSPNRLQRAKAMLSRLIDGLPDDRVGLVLFAGHSYIQMPLTTDHNAAKMFIASASPGAIAAQGTAIADALTKSNLAFQQGSDRFKAIVLVTDGETHDENAVETAQDLASKGVMINTVGIGSPSGGTIFDTATQTEKRDAAGNVILSRLNEPLLRQVAAATNGVYINLQNSEQSVAQMVQQLSQIEKKALGDSSVFTYRTFYAWLAVPMLLLLLGEFFFSDRKKVKK